MNPTPIISSPRRTGLGLCLMTCAILFLLSGCLEQRIHWAPDGRRALLITKQGLHLCSPEGKLSAPLLSDVSRAAWLSDSSHAVLVRETRSSEWALCKEVLGGKKSADVEGEALALTEKLKAGTAIWSVATLNLQNEQDALFVCLKSFYSEPLRSKLTQEEQKNLQESSLRFNEVILVSFDENSAKVERVIARREHDILDLRPSPDGAVIVWSEESLQRKDKAYVLALASVKEQSDVTLLSQLSAGFPDWSPDGLSLVSCEALGNSFIDDDLGNMGVICRRTVRAQDGRIEVAKERFELAGVLFDANTRVRCLKDGRILFNATELNIPASKAEMKDLRQSLCMLDLSRHSKILRPVALSEAGKLPEVLAFFEPSPDGSQVLFSGISTEVSLLTLASGEVEVIQNKSKEGHSSMASWRKDGEFSYFKRNALYGTLKKDEKAPARPFEIVQHGGKVEEILSGAWSDAFIGALEKGK